MENSFNWHQNKNKNISPGYKVCYYKFPSNRKMQKVSFLKLCVPVRHWGCWEARTDQAFLATVLKPGCASHAPRGLVKAPVAQLHTELDSVVLLWPFILCISSEFPKGQPWSTSPGEKKPLHICCCRSRDSPLRVNTFHLCRLFWWPLVLGIWLGQTEMCHGYKYIGGFEDSL